MIWTAHGSSVVSFPFKHMQQKVSMINLNIANCLKIHLYHKGRSEEQTKLVNEIKERMEAKSYFWTFPTVKLDKCMILRTIL